MDKKDIIAILVKRIDLKGLVMEDILEGVIEPKLDELVASTSTSLDDTAKALIMPELKKALDEFLGEKLDELKA